MGAVGGIFYKRKVQFIPLLVVVFFTSIFTTTINSIQLYIWTGWGAVLGNLPLRISTMIVKWPITTVLVYVLYHQVAVVILKDKWRMKKKEETKTDKYITRKSKSRINNVKTQKD